MSNDKFVPDDSFACRQCGETDCEYECPSCHKIFAKCYIVDGVCFMCKIKQKNERDGE